MPGIFSVWDCNRDICWRSIFIRIHFTPPQRVTFRVRISSSLAKSLSILHCRALTGHFIMTLKLPIPNFRPLNPTANPFLSDIHPLTWIFQGKYRVKGYLRFWISVNRGCEVSCEVKGVKVGGSLQPVAKLKLENLSSKMGNKEICLTPDQIQLLINGLCEFILFY